jgi:hypothetical protein
MGEINDIAVRGTGALKPLEIGVSGGKSGPGGTFEDLLPGKVLCECSIPDFPWLPEVAKAEGPGGVGSAIKVTKLALNV